MKGKKNYSAWWQDLVSIENDLLEEVFPNGCCFLVGDGFSTPFWLSSWLERGRIKELFPTLFSVSLLQDVSVTATGGWLGGTWNRGDLGTAIAPFLNVTAAGEMLQLSILLH